MEPLDNNQLQLLGSDELALRLQHVRSAMSSAGIDAALLCDNATLYYLTGRVFCGYIYLPLNGTPTYALRRPCHLRNENIVPIHKIEELPTILGLNGITFGLEMGLQPYNSIVRIQKALGDNIRYADITPAMADARSVKTPAEIEKLRVSGIKQTGIYRRIPDIYQPGMRDIDLQIEIERMARLEGCLGQFRVSGRDMELFMGNILVGDNADTPSPYDFAMGGAGMDPSLPVGANGTDIIPGKSVMVDMNGNFTGYMTDMTRCFALNDSLDDKAKKAHQLSIDICETLAQIGRPGVQASLLYETARRMAEEAGLGNEFMGHRQHAGFVGHGIGIEINELPVIAPRSKSILQAGNVIALEPKFVIPGTGAVGVENTYIVRDNGPMERITDAPQEIIYFE